MDTFWRSTQLGVIALGGFIINVLFARYFSTEQFALWALAFSFLFTFSLFGDFGLGATIAKFTSQYNSTDKELLPSLITTGLANLILNCAGIYIIILITAPVIGFLLEKPDLTILLMIGGIYVISKIEFEFMSEFFRGFQIFKIPALTLGLCTAIETACYIFLIYRYANITLFEIFLIRCGFWTAKGIILALLFYRFIKSKDITIRPSLLCPNLFVNLTKFSLPIGISLISWYLYTKVDIILVAAFSQEMEIARYTVAENIFICPLLIPAAFAAVISPKATAYFYSNNHEKLQNLFSLSITLIFISMSVISVFFFVFSKYILLIFFPKYISSSIFLKLLAPLIVFKGIEHTALAGFLVATGNPKILAKLTVIAAILNVIGDLIMIPPFGALGAFLVTVIVHSIYTVFAVRYVTMKLGLKISLKFPDTMSIKNLLGNRR